MTGDLRVYQADESNKRVIQRYEKERCNNREGTKNIPMISGSIERGGKKVECCTRKKEGTRNRRGETDERGFDSLDPGSYKETWEGNIMERRKYRIPICT